MHYEKKIIDDIPHILAASAAVIERVREVMALHKTNPTIIDHLLTLREDLAMYLAQFDAGIHLPEDKIIDLEEQEDQATRLLGELERDDHDYEHPEIRRLRSVSLGARLRMMEQDMREIARLESELESLGG